MQEPQVCPSSLGDGGGDGESAAAILGETALGRDAGRRAKHGQSCSTSSAMQPPARNVRHADMERKLGIVAKSRMAAAWQARAADSARARCLRQHSCASIAGSITGRPSIGVGCGTLALKLAKEKLRAADSRYRRITGA